MPTDSYTGSTTRVLVVEGSAEGRDRAVRFLVDDMGWEAEAVASAKDAVGLVEGACPHMILAGLHGSEPLSLSLIEDLHQRVPDLPVVILMDEGAEAMTLSALQKGAAGYASTSHLEAELPEILDRVISAARSVRDRRRLRECLTSVDLEFNLDNDPAMVPALVADVQDHMGILGFGDKSALVRLGVALEEALLNAIIHGNLEISSAIKQIDDSLYLKEIQNRRVAKPYCRRRLRFRARLRKTRAEFVIADSGPGFDPSSLPDPTDPINLERVSGRGLLLIRTFMDEVRFNRKGNRIRMVKHLVSTN